MGTFAAQMIQFAYETYVVRDRVTVSYEGSLIFDSGCVGTDGEKVSPISFSGFQELIDFFKKVFRQFIGT